MSSPNAGSVQVAVVGLRQALEKAGASFTVQEGLYRAYMAHLCDLDTVDDMPPVIGAEVHELVRDLRCAFGFDEGGTKLAPSTLEPQHAAQLLERLRAVTSSAEGLAKNAQRVPH